MMEYCRNIFDGFDSCTALRSDPHLRIEQRGMSARHPQSFENLPIEARIGHERAMGTGRENRRASWGAKRTVHVFESIPRHPWLSVWSTSEAGTVSRRRA